MTTHRSDSNQFNRREFLSVSAAAGTGVLIGAQALTAVGDESGGNASNSRKRYALVGVGGRSGMYREAILKTYAAHCQMVGYCDLNVGRLKLAQAKAREMANVEVPIYEANDFDRMIRETRPEIVIVTTKDATHSRYIIRAMELGCDVMTEKPMTTDEKQCRAILQAQRKTGRRCRVTFNYRYSPHRTQVKDLLMSGVIGDVLSADFHWLLDTRHGADYFRRWHSQKSNSGGLMVHKATHHFDLMNWWLSAVPVSVMAKGKREFYTPQMAKRLGLQSHHERCRTCPEKDNCTFYLDLAADPKLKELYLDQEQYDGYYRDQCVWRPGIDIEDTMNVQVRYNTGATMAYSLNAFNGWEGYIVSFNGTKGRLEHKEEEKVYLSNDDSLPHAVKAEGTYIRIYPMRAPAYEVEIWKGEGAHGGGDKVMLDDLFLPQKPSDKYVRASDQRGGAYSILTGIAANHSFVTGKDIEIADLVPGIALPDYPPMPSHDVPVPMPPRV
ncbi:MAG TPA: Gfo/Idh/MocA family oxidoreductase [Nitrospiraceae bacterium]|jgi:predicted dehydrogenase|nr:Gfo/Idh/MocA family oxidoreductase [Nitrospiraceae bacterium]